MNEIMLADILARLQKQASAGESGVAAAFELNWQSLESETQKLACLLSLFPITPIPWSMVESAASYSDLKFDLKANLTILVERYLLQELADDTYQVHECIQEFLQQKLEELAQAGELKRGYSQAIGSRKDTKAYLLEDWVEEDRTYDYRKAVVFATNKEEAKKQANCISSDWEYVHCKRVPEFDEYSTLGYVPAKVLYDLDWLLYCDCCQSEVSLDYEPDEESDEDWEIYDPQFVEGLVYCCPTCKEQEWYKAKIKQEGLELFKSLFKNTTIEYTYLTVDLAFGVTFNFPGGSSTVNWVTNQPQAVSIAPVDVEAWEKYKLSSYDFKENGL